MENNIAILGYTLNEKNVIENLFTVQKNEAEGIPSDALVMFETTGETSLASTAMKKFEELFSKKIDDEKKWRWLGELTCEPFADTKILVFGVDLTGISDLSTSPEKGISVPVEIAMKSSNAIFQAAFFKLFMTIYKKDI